MLYVAFAVMIFAATLHLVRGAVIAGGHWQTSGFNGMGVVFSFAVFAFLSLAVGPIVSLALLVSVFLADLGQVLALRLLKQPDAALRLVPMPFDGAGQRANLDDPLARAFVALMGPGLTLAPMGLSFALSNLWATSHTGLAETAWLFGVTCGAYGFVCLLPFPPLPGGRVLQSVARGLMPGLTPWLSGFLGLAFALAALREGSVALFVLAAMGIVGVFRLDAPGLKALSTENALRVLAAYAFTFAAHFSGGWLLVDLLFLNR